MVHPASDISKGNRMQAFLAVLTCALMLSVFLMLPTQACAA